MQYQNCGDTERKREPGTEPGPSGVSVQEENPLYIRRARDGERRIVAKSVEEPSRKAAIVCCMPVP